MFVVQLLNESTDGKPFTLAFENLYNAKKYVIYRFNSRVKTYSPTFLQEYKFHEGDLYEIHYKRFDGVKFRRSVVNKNLVFDWERFKNIVETYNHHTKNEEQKQFMFDILTVPFIHTNKF